jgi:hypothetical protein
MSHRLEQVVPFRFDLSTLLPRSVATLYSHLVTRPTGQALRLGIEGQLAEVGQLCLSVLDFSQVSILDFSCADETVAKLLARYRAEDRPAEAYFVARGIAERHREPIEGALARRALALVAETDGGEVVLLGEVPPMHRMAWGAVQALGRASVAEVAARLGVPAAMAAPVLEDLAALRVVLRPPGGEPAYYALEPMVRGR